MALRLTLDIFSGRPNPVVVIDGPEEKELLQRIGTGKKARPASERFPAPLTHLGYRGVLIEPLLAPAAHGKAAPPVGSKSSTSLRLAGGLVHTRTRAFEPLDPQIEEFLCGRRGPFRLAGFDPFFLDFCRNETWHLHEVMRLWPWKKWPWPKGTPCKCAPLWEPAWWNDAGQVRYNNNCYNYATNYRSDTYAQPGLAANAQYPQISCPQVKVAAIADKLIDTPNANNKCPQEGHLVALVVGPGRDFHWYRKGRNGYWTHKPGGSQATPYDNSGKLIKDPRTADRGFYTDFCSFMTVMHGHVKIR